MAGHQRTRLWNGANRQTLVSSKKRREVVMRHSAKLYLVHSTRPKEPDSSNIYGGIAIVVVSFAAIAFIVSIFVEPSPRLSPRGDFGLTSVNALSR
jgi:hypothetical protein